MKKFLYSSSIIAALLLIGCGEGSSITESNINYEEANVFTAVPKNVSYTDYTVKVVDEAIIGANVKAFECNSSKDLGNGNYVLLNCVSKPAYIVVEGGEIGKSGVKQNFPLVLNTSQTNLNDYFVVTPLTTLLVDADESEIEDIANKLGIDKNKLFEEPENVNEINMTNVLQKVNAIYLKAEADGAIANKLQFIKVVRTKLKEKVKNGDFNVTEVASEVEQISQAKPGLFGLVFIKDIKDTKNILEEIKEAQNPAKVTFLGIVFDKILSNIRVYRADTNETINNTSTDNSGKWKLTLNSNWQRKIENEDFVIKMEAKSADGKIVLVSSVTSVTIRNLMHKYETKKISPSKTFDFIISNVTTAENAILEKRGVFKSNINSYDSNRTNLKTYYGDRILKAAAVIQDVVDNNNTSLLNNAKNTYYLIINNIENSRDVNFSNKIRSLNTSNIEKKITKNSILNRQLGYIPIFYQTNKATFEEAANKAGNVFYRLLAYYEAGEDGKLGTGDDVFVREYQRIIAMPGYYELKTCILENEETIEWKNCNTVSSQNANFKNGDYTVNMNNSYGVKYSLENNESVFVNKLCKSYNLYQISKQTLVENEVNSTVAEVVVDSFDVVDMFRRMPSEQPKSFDSLKDLVRGKGRDEVNMDLNRYIKEHIEDIKHYFSDENTNNTCNQ